MDWDDLPDEPYYNERTRDKIRDFFQARNRWRWNRLQRDYAWLRKEMKKVGLNPEDARYLL